MKQVERDQRHRHAAQGGIKAANAAGKSGMERVGEDRFQNQA